MLLPNPSHERLKTYPELQGARLEVGLCDPCYALAECRPRTAPHAALRFLSSMPVSDHPTLAREAGGRIDQYCCVTCQTRWHLRVDRHDVSRGFQLAPG